MKISELLERIQPYVLGWISESGGGAGPYAPTPHDLHGGHHSGTLDAAQFPDALLRDGSRSLLGNLVVATGITIDGVDISVLKGDFDAHALGTAAAGHAGGVGTHAHTTAGSGGQLDHATALTNIQPDQHHAPVSIGAGGLSAKLTLVGQVLTLAAINHSDLSSVTADQHHAGFVGLRDHVGTLVSPAADDTIQLVAGTGVTVVAGTNLLTLAHASGSLGDLHTNYAEHGSAENITGAWTFATHLLPDATDTRDVGSATLLWRKGWFSELESLRFVENTIQLIGGWLMIPHGSGTLAEAVDTSQTAVDFGQAMTVNDFVLLRGNGQVEYMKIVSAGKGTVYNVTRNVDGSGANSWPVGQAYAILGNSGDGRIELDAQTAGPQLRITLQGATYDAQTEIIRMGDLTGWQSAGLTGYGWAVGDYAGNEFGYFTPGSGLVLRGTIRADDGYLGALSIDGVLAVGASGGIYQGSGTFASPTTGLKVWNDSGVGRIAGYNAGTVQWYAGSDGKLYAGGGAVTLSANGMVLAAGSAGANSISWVSSAVTIGSIYTANNSGNTLMQIYAQQPAAGGDTQIKLVSWKGGDGISLNLHGGSAGYVSIEKEGMAGAGNNDLRVGGGLYIGSTSTDPTDDDVYMDGSVKKSTPLGARAQRSTTQSIASGAWTALSFDTEVSDTDGLWTSGSATRFTAQRAGYYMAGGSVVTDAAAGYRLALSVRVNGAQYIAASQIATLSSNELLSVSTGMFYLAASDYVEICLYQDSGSAITTNAATSNNQHSNSGWLARIV